MMNAVGLKESRPPFDIKNIALGKIDFRIGIPYVYRHSLHCDHIFIISEVRIFN